MKHVETQASAMVKQDKHVPSCLLEFELRCDALAHNDNEVNSTGAGDKAKASGIGQTFQLIGKTANTILAIISDHYKRELSCFTEPHHDHLKMVHDVKVAYLRCHFIHYIRSLWTGVELELLCQTAS